MIGIKISTGKEFHANWCGVSSLSGDVIVEKEDARVLHEIAEELEGAGWIEQDDTQERHDGPFTVGRISREKNGMVRITMRKGNEA